ncbi:beta-ketoacyl-[acyl-carrier-protein] synthase family protein [Proteus myxofaciens]|uniref:3-oxoacyl-[acyl-carrier-protein] synthase n=1 Tax=Proteus myxofaciens ATCC 19692 TaxID=1354337 RepID=A0A198FZJ5_9GAMM|nr:beta-ketoacyl-[acyl-carrier-protein] synthase family protein [Proteus myxofaciens]OAT30502.1 3-oxoacyl-[acyl-carrier-protein] synthase [Proteus myxofaciens ATCC 19692]
MNIKRRRVVITGMGVLSSLAKNIPEFKQVLFKKKCNIKPSQRYLKWFEHANASEIEMVINYDDIPKNIVEYLDNAALWAYRVSSEALQQAHLKDNQAILNHTAMIVGVSSAGTEAFLPLFEQHIDDFSIKKAILSGGFSSCCSSVSSLLGLRGGIELVATACTASPNAIGMGYDYIQNGKNPVVLAVGTEPIYLPTFAGFYALNVMKKQPTSPFSGIPGMSIGEGAGALVLEEYEHALARGATIYGEIVSYATSCDAYHETGPSPSGAGAVQVMQKAIRNAGIEPKEIEYINVHGTGTEANDRIETMSMKKVFPHIYETPLSSTKSYVGHNIGAAGIVEIIACFISLAEGKILPTLNFTKPRQSCDLNYVPNEFQDKKVKLFMKNNYAFGGNNCSIIASPQLAEIEPQEYHAKRVVITGLGAITSLGNSVREIMQTLWKNKKQGVLKKIVFDDDVQKDINNLMSVVIKDKEFEASLGHPYFNQERDNHLKTHACYHAVNNAEPKKRLRRFDARKAVPSGTYALLALNEALTDANRKINRDGDNLGFIVGMSKGPQSTVNRYLQSLIPDPTKVRTSEFPGTLMNAVPTFCAITEGIKGYTTTLATGVNAALGALTYGYEIIRQDLQPQVIVGGADEHFGSISLYFQAMSEKINLTTQVEDYQIYSKEKTGYIPGEGACMLFIEDREYANKRGAKIYAEIVGYGKSNDTTFLDEDNISEKIDALSMAIEQAFVEAQLNPGDIDIICGTSDGNKENDKVEINAIRQVFFKTSPQVPVVNYNALFGLVESCSGLLAITLIINMMLEEKIMPFPYTNKFIDNDINFITKPLNKKINYALILGSSEGCNHYAIIIRKPI